MDSGENANVIPASSVVLMLSAVRVILHYPFTAQRLHYRSHSTQGPGLQWKRIATLLTATPAKRERDELTRAEGGLHLFTVDQCDDLPLLRI